jgi:hypothetical protein
MYIRLSGTTVRKRANRPPPPVSELPRFLFAQDVTDPDELHADYVCLLMCVSFWVYKH